jgi:hypothetical protein
MFMEYELLPKNACSGVPFVFFSHLMLVDLFVEITLSKQQFHKLFETHPLVAELAA